MTTTRQGAPTDTTNPLHKAIHEAGHAVAAVLEGKRLTRVSLEPACTSVHEPDEHRTNDFWQTRVALAGFVADHIVTKDPAPLTHRRMSSGEGADEPGNDWELALLRVSQAMDPEPTADNPIRDCLLEQQRIVTNMLKRHWAAVELVAQGLLDHGTLDGDQVRRAVDATR